MFFVNWLLYVLVCFIHGRTIGDKAGEAKACGNVGNTLKVLGNFDDALDYCHQHLTLADQLKDKVSLALLLFSLRHQLF